MSFERTRVMVRERLSACCLRAQTGATKRNMAKRVVVNLPSLSVTSCKLPVLLPESDRVCSSMDMLLVWVAAVVRESGCGCVEVHE